MQLEQQQRQSQVNWLEDCPPIIRVITDERGPCVTRAFPERPRRKLLIQRLIEYIRLPPALKAFFSETKNLKAIFKYLVWLIIFTLGVRALFIVNTNSAADNHLNGTNSDKLLVVEEKLLNRLLQQLMLNARFLPIVNTSAPNPPQLAHNKEAKQAEQNTTSENHVD